MSPDSGITIADLFIMLCNRSTRTTRDGILIANTGAWRLPHIDPTVTAELNSYFSVDRTLNSSASTNQTIEVRFSAALGEEENPDVEGRGYKGIGEEMQDLDAVIDIVWISGTPALQTTFLLAIALTVTTSLTSFPFVPRPTFQLLHKLDLAFASLLRGSDIETGAPLPGSETGKSRLSTTEMVRMRGIVERSRVAVVEVAGKDGSLTPERSVAQVQTDTEDDFNMTTDDGSDDLEDESSPRRWEMDIARVYEKTIVELGLALVTMPTYYARSLNIRLSVADLVKTTTAYPVTGLSAAGIVQKDRALDQFERDAETGTLAETPLPVDDDNNDGLRLGFIGKCQSLPLIMVHAKPKYPFSTTSPNDRSRGKRPPPLVIDTQVADGYDSPLSDLSSPPLSPLPASDGSNPQAAEPVEQRDQNITRAPITHQLDGTADSENAGLSWAGTPGQQQWPNAGNSKAPGPTHDHKNSVLWSGQESSLHAPYGEESSPPSPQALCVRVMPGINAFRSPAPGADQDLKFDVFLDGELCTSTSMSKILFAKEKSRIIFSGARIGQVIEKPWCLMPPARMAYGGPNPSSAQGHIVEFAQSRWKHVSQKLVLAAKLTGPSIDSELPVLGQYLQALASVKMPGALPGMLTTNMTGFAVIDVVVSTGKLDTKEQSSPYLKQPTYLPIHGFGLENDDSARRRAEARTKREAVSRAREADRGKSKAHEQIAKQLSPLHRELYSTLGRSARKSIGDTRKPTGPSGTLEVEHLLGNLSLMNHNRGDSASTPLAPEPNQSHVIAPPSHARKMPVSEPRKQQSFSMPKVTEPTSTGIPRKRGASLISAYPTPMTIPAGPPAPLQKSSGERVKRPRMPYYNVFTTARTQEEEMEAIVKDAAQDAQRRITRSEMVNSGKEVDITVDISTQASAIMNRAMKPPRIRKPSARKSSMGGPRKQPAKPARISDPFTSKPLTATATPHNAQDTPLPSIENASPSSSKWQLPSTSPPREPVAYPTSSSDSSSDRPLIQHYSKPPPTMRASKIPQPTISASNTPPTPAMIKPTRTVRFSIDEQTTPHPQSAKSSSPAQKDHTGARAQVTTVKGSSGWEIPAISRDGVVGYKEGGM
ncbi:MAG: hypothetical protein Q9194_005605, partial [Teloschistes cf. exilis]